MKKYILTTLMLVLGISLGIGITAQANQLWEYGVFSDRAEVAESIGIEDYAGTYNQNLALLEWYEAQSDSEPSFGSTLPIAGSTYTLAGSGITSSGASITLQSFTIPQNGYEIQDSDLSGTFYITLEPGSTKRQEIASCTTVTQNANDTATLSGCTRGLSPITPFTASSSLLFAHAGGTQVIFSDPPQLFNEYVSLANDETITGLKTFSIFPEFSDGTTPTTTNQFATKGYVDNVTNQGAATSTVTVAGIAELATRIENASSTAWGVNDPHVQQSEHATSTPSANAFTDGVVWDIWSDNSGYLSQSWLNLTEGFIFSKVTTTDFEIVGTTVSSTALVNVTDGSLANDKHQHDRVTSYFTTTTPSTITGTTEGTLMTTTITGGDMDSNSILRVKFRGRIGGTESLRWFIIKFGGVTVASSTVMNLNGTGFDVSVDIYNDGSTSAQDAFFTNITAGDADAQENRQASTTAMTIDTTSDQTLLITGDTSDGSGTITLDALDIQLIK